MELVLEGTVNEAYLRIPLEKEYSRIGRSKEADIQLDNRTVSRFHAAIRMDDHHVTIEDLGSHNGTFLNGQRITGHATVNQRDEIKIGSISLTLLPASAPAVGMQQIATLLLPDGAVRTLHQIPLEEIRRTKDETLSSVSELTVMHSGLLEIVDGPRPPLGTYKGSLQVITEMLPQMIVPQTLDEAVQTLPELIESVVTPRTLILILRDSKHLEFYLKAAWPPKALQQRNALLTSSILNDVMKGHSSYLLAASEPLDKRNEEEASHSTDRFAFAAPLWVDDDAVGLIYVGGDDPKLMDAETALQAFNFSASLYALKVGQCIKFDKRLREFAQIQREKDRMTDAISIAAGIQRKLLPEIHPEIPNYELFAELCPSLETAGDLYDVTKFSATSIGIVVGDVSGKGLGAALLMTNVLASLRMSLTDTCSLTAVVERLNVQLEKSTEAQHFVTLFLGRLDLARNELEYVNAGHNSPFLLTPGVEPRRLSATGIPAGMMPMTTYACRTTDFPIGSLLCVFTDGIPEAAAEGQEYGEDRLLQTLLQCFNQPVREIGQALSDDLDAFLRETSPNDDTTLLLIRRTG